MGKIPCRLCGSCGRYSDLSVQTCQCGEILSETPGRLVDEPIPPEQCGKIDRSLQIPVFVQICTHCGKENFTTNPARRVGRCYCCHKTRVASFEPVPYEPEQDGKKDGQAEQPPEAAPHPAPAEEGGEGDGTAAHWRAVLEGVQSCVSGSATSWPDSGEDGEDGVTWDGLLGGVRPEAVLGTVPASSQGGRRLTLTAIRYGPMSLTLQAGQRDLPFLLGRSAGCGEFLSQDLRVSNEHCYLTFQNGDWVVIDNHSANGTAVNRQFLEFNGQRVLRDGDELTLGHHPDSMAFRVGIQ